MANDNLRAALKGAGLAPDDLAQIVQVDVRTVRRWLSGGTPYSRQRAKVARALDSTEHDLWPELVTTRPPTSVGARASGLLAGYPAASGPDAPDREALMSGASDRIELLGDTLIEVLLTPGVPELLITKGARGCDIRILIYDTGPHLPPLLNQPGIEIRRLEDPAAYNIHRYDEQLLLTLHAVGPDPDQGPLIHICRAASGGLFDRLADYYDDLWERGSEPLGPELDLPPQEDRVEGQYFGSDPPLSAGERPAVGHDDHSAPRSRRWPRRAEDPRDHG